MTELSADLTVIDTMLGGVSGLMAALLVNGPSPAVVDVGPETSAAVVIAAIEAQGIGPADLAWIVLTHIHLDHCGATGALARHFPNAQVVVHGRGARHLAEPDRLVAASHAVYGPQTYLYGGLSATDERRITVAEDGHRVVVGPGRELVMLEAPGHARHHMAVLDEATGTLVAGDALGVSFEGCPLYPTLPPSDIDPVAGDATLARIAGIDPSALMISHYGFMAEPQAEVATAREQLATVSKAVRAAWDRNPEVASIASAIEAALPLGDAALTADAQARWELTQWAAANAHGLAGWAERTA